MAGLVAFGRHGSSADEWALGQRLRVDVAAWFPLAQAGASDDLEDTLNYADIARCVRLFVCQGIRSVYAGVCTEVSPIW